MMAQQDENEEAEDSISGNEVSHAHFSKARPMPFADQMADLSAIDSNEKNKAGYTA